jgi:alkaline phosphatase D
MMPGVCDPNLKSGVQREAPFGYTRRQFLRLLALTPVALAGVRRANAAFALRFSPAAFDATQNSVLIWVRGSAAARVRVDFGIEAAPARLARGPSVTLSRDSDYSAAIPLTGLAPGKTWSYRIVDLDSGKPLSEPGRFKTAPMNATPFTFAFSADTDESYRPFKLFDIIDGKHPDFFLHLGDTVYADYPRQDKFAPSISHYRTKHAAIRRDPHLQNFLARHVTYATWDDHEIEDNAHSRNPHIEKAFRVFKEYWPCKAVDPAALYRQFAWAGVDFFMLDTRRFRSPQTMPDGPDKTMLGTAQKNWLKERVKASTAPFKFVVTSVPFHADGPDSWAFYGTERDEIARFLRGENIRGVILLTGDYHLARDWSDAATGLREYMAGPIASIAHYQFNPDARARYQKTGAFHYGDGCNFGFWRVDPAAGKAALEFIGPGGESLFRTEIVAGRFPT